MSDGFKTILIVNFKSAVCPPISSLRVLQHIYVNIRNLNEILYINIRQLEYRIKDYKKNKFLKHILLLTEL